MDKNKCKLCNEREVVSKGFCAKCYVKNWRKNNPDKVKLNNKKRYQENKEKYEEYRNNNKERIKELGLINYERKKEERKQYQRDYKANDPEKVRKSQRDSLKKYPEKIKQNHDNQYFNGMRIKALERDNFTCQECGMTEEEHLKKWGYSLIVHHKDGNGWGKKDKNNTLQNLQTLCKICHGKKHGRKIS